MGPQRRRHGLGNEIAAKGLLDAGLMRRHHGDLLGGHPAQRENFGHVDMASPSGLAGEVAVDVLPFTEE